MTLGNKQNYCYEYYQWKDLPIYNNDAYLKSSLCPSFFLDINNNGDTQNFALNQLNSYFLSIFGNFFHNIDLVIVTDWNDWFDGNPNMTIFKSYSSNITIACNSHIFLCIFINIESSVTYSMNDISLCVEESSFLDCFRSNNNDGGAIYFKGSHCVLAKICAHRCNTSSGYSGQFCYVQVKYSYLYHNIAYLLSVSECAQYTNHDRFRSIDFYYGNISCKNINSSTNRCYMYSGIYFYGPFLLNATQSTFINNTDCNSICIGFYSNFHNMSLCNIIKNYQMQTSNAVIFCNDAQTYISDCIIDANSGTNTIIQAYLGQVTIRHCYLQPNTQKLGNINIESVINSNLTIALNHLDSQFCYSILHHVNSYHLSHSFNPPLIVLSFLLVTILPFIFQE